MPQSLGALYVHVIFSTKDRTPCLPRAIRPDLRAYTAGTLRNLDCTLVDFNSLADHVHILCTLSRTLAIAKLLEEMKKASSKWLKPKAPALRNFHWQNGYGAFSVSPSKVPEVRRYIDNQDEHHRKLTFQEEYRAFLERHGIAYDERYVWD